MGGFLVAADARKTPACPAARAATLAKVTWLARLRKPRLSMERARLSLKSLVVRSNTVLTSLE